MKKILLGLLAATLLLASCSKSESTSSGGSQAKLKVGMVTDAGTIDDKSFNQGTWEGILRAQKELGIECRYLRPSGTTEADYLKEIQNLADSGHTVIICPGFKFETAVYAAQSQYPNIKFVILDGEPRDASGNASVANNTVAIYWDEHHAGFAAGVAAAVCVGSGEAGFIGGMEIPAVQKFNWGWQQGIAYANSNFGANVTIKAENVIYQGSFDNVAAGQQLAASMYDKGVKVIHAAAGGVGVGVINESKTRRTNGEDVWVVGVDVDQYEDGMMPNGKSSVLTSAMKNVGKASYDMVAAVLNGSFPGGKTMTLNALTDDAGIPENNPNLTEAADAAAKQALADLKAGKIVVKASPEGLIN